LAPDRSEGHFRITTGQMAVITSFEAGYLQFQSCSFSVTFEDFLNSVPGGSG